MPDEFIASYLMEFGGPTGHFNIAFTELPAGFAQLWLSWSANTLSMLLVDVVIITEGINGSSARYIIALMYFKQQAFA